MQRPKRRSLAFLNDLPAPLYLFMRSVLQLCCLLFLLSFALFAQLQAQGWDRELYALAMYIGLQPAGLLFCGTISLAMLWDHCMR